MCNYTVIKKDNLKQNIYLHIKLIICKYRTIFLTYKVYIPYGILINFTNKIYYKYLQKLKISKIYLVLIIY